MIYLDHAATTPMYPAVFQEMIPWMLPDHVGNAGSTHSQGRATHHAIEKARIQVADMISAQPSEIFFTSGGTESNNLVAHILHQFCQRILTTPFEHASVRASLGEDWIMPVNVNHNGTLLKEEFDKACDGFAGIIGVSVMWVNNEIGSVQPIQEIAAECNARHNVIFHTDATQAIGHVSVRTWNGIDLLTMSAHKFGGPQGIGAIYISKRIQRMLGQNPLILGGGQERGMRSGTENVAGIVGMGKAAEIVSSKSEYEIKNFYKALRSAFYHSFAKYMQKYSYRTNGDTSLNIISLTIPGVESESLMMLLDKEGICVSAGSACSAASKEPSATLKAIGLSDDDASCTIRISMGWNTTEREMVTAARIIAEQVDRVKQLYHS